MSRLDGIYRGESADEWLGITCPDDCAPLDSIADLDADYNAERRTYCAICGDPVDHRITPDSATMVCDADVIVFGEFAWHKDCAEDVRRDLEAA